MQRKSLSVLTTEPKIISGTYQDFPFSAKVTGDLCPSSGSSVEAVFDVELTVDADNGSVNISVKCNITVTMTGTRIS